MKKVLLVLVLSQFGLFCEYAFGANDLYQEGDIIGESEIGAAPSTVIFEAGTSSRFGHVGIILKENNEFVVFEETPPVVKTTKLSDFIGKSQGAYAVIRLRPGD